MGCENISNSPIPSLCGLQTSFIHILFCLTFILPPIYLRHTNLQLPKFLHLHCKQISHQNCGAHKSFPYHLTCMSSLSAISPLQYFLFYFFQHNINMAHLFLTLASPYNKPLSQYKISLYSIIIKTFDHTIQPKEPQLTFFFHFCLMSMNFVYTSQFFIL